MSLMPIEMPALVAYSKPISLSRSAKMTVALLPAFWKAASINSLSSFFFITRLISANGISEGTISLSRMRPTVVSTVSPSTRTAILACNSTTSWS